MAKRKQIEVFVPAQMGFGFNDVFNADGQVAPFLFNPEDVLAAIDRIQQAAWVSVDTEGTGLTDASMPVQLTPAEMKQGSSNRVRTRTIQVRIPTVRGRCGPRENFVFDADRMGPELTAQVCDVILSRRLFIAHNAGFDLYWCRLNSATRPMPEFVCDTMLLTRLLKPTLVLERAELIKQLRTIHDVQFGDDLERAAWKSLISGASGGSLADVVLSAFHVIVDKTYQKPNNWTGLLGYEHYNYAIDDAVWADRIMCFLLGITEEDDLLRAYLRLRAQNKQLQLVEPQVPELVELREHGMPLNQMVGERFVVRKRAELAVKVQQLIGIEPSLEKFSSELADPDAGLGDSLKKALATAFELRGVMLRKTPQGAPQVGEKDLRACRAAQISESKELFGAWVAVCRSKKTSNMALEVLGFARRAKDSYVRALLSHGPVTGRLAASEPNVQQWPRDQLFRAMCMSPIKPGHEKMTLVATELSASFLSSVASHDVVVGESVTLDTAWVAAMFYSDKKVPDWPAKEKNELEELILSQFTHMIVASDFGALDVRVGAALCIRSQREMLDLAKGISVPGPVQPSDLIVSVIKKVVQVADAPNAAAALTELAQDYAESVKRFDKRLEKLKLDVDTQAISKKVFFDRRSKIREEQHAHKLGWRFSQCLALGAERSEREYSALRDAFVADIDIHTFTGMKLVGRDPMKEFEGLTHADRKALEKKLKKELGPRRQQGKIANLSLLYGMADAGFQEAAARGYDEHWTMEEAHDIRDLWMNAYPEVELWHLWTECLQVGTVYLPEQGSEKTKRTGWWMARTLADREIVAFGLNAALSYQDQSSGADILGMIMHRLKLEHPVIFDRSINQVHDELVLALDMQSFKEDLEIVENVMVEEANRLIMPYGVPAAVSPACGPIWIKD